MSKMSKALNLIAFLLDCFIDCGIEESADELVNLVEVLNTPAKQASGCKFYANTSRKHKSTIPYILPTG
jgi:hypothetical protein